MRFAFVILFLMLFGAASAADMETVGAAEAERQAAAEAERAAKEATSTPPSAAEVPQPALSATTATVTPPVPGAIVACGQADIADAATASAIEAKAKADADAHAAAPAQLALIGPDSSAALAASHSLEPSAAGRAYFAGVCARLLEIGAADAVQPVLADLARKLGVAYPATATAGSPPVSTTAETSVPTSPAGPDAAAAAQQEAERAAKEAAEREAAERAAKEAAEREAAERAAKETAEREAAERAAKETAEREAAERAAKETAEREAAERAAKETAEREAAERAARETAEREAAERVARETAEREAAERAARETAEREAAEKTASEQAQSRSAGGDGATPAQQTAAAEPPASAPVDTAPPPPAGAAPSAAPTPAPSAMPAAPESPVAAAPPAPAPAAPASPPAPSLDEARPSPPPSATPGADGMLGEAECRAVGVLGQCPDLNSVLARLLEKPLEYNHPKEMLLGNATEITLVLRTDWEGKDLPAEISEELKGLPGEVKQGLSKVTRVMSAELSGRNFEVSPAGRQERTVSPPQQVAWNWQVKPSETGPSQPLKLRLYAHLQGPDGTMPPLLVKTLDATINVDVTTWDWIVNQARTLEPIYAVGAALIGLMTALMTFLLSRRRREGYDGPGGDLYRADNEPTTPNGPVIGDLNQSAADSRVTSPPPAPAAAPPPVEDKQGKPTGTIPVDPDGGIEPKKD